VLLGNPRTPDALYCLDLASKRGQVEVYLCQSILFHSINHTLLGASGLVLAKYCSCPYPYSSIPTCWWRRRGKIPHYELW
jgi:hypothetical protein